MQSTLFTTLTSAEEANLSGGFKWSSYYKEKEEDEEDDDEASSKTVNFGFNFAKVDQTQVVIGKKNFAVQKANVSQKNAA